MRSSLSKCGIVAAGLFLVSATVMSQEEKGKTGPPGADKPGAEHKQLARLAGEYNTVSRFWIKPDDKPMESKGSAKITSVVEGRCLLEEDTGTQLGQPYQGMRLITYINGSKQYEASWTYTLATGLMSLTGTSKDGGKTIDWTTSYLDEKGEKKALNATTKLIDDDHFVVELVAKTPDGKKGPTLETTYTRKK
jgi:hypothetical protein